MDAALAWAIAALVLVIAELLSGTFEQPFPTQCIVAALLGAIGCYGVHVYRARYAATRMPPIDAGMPATACCARGAAQLARRTAVQAEHGGERHAHPEMRLRRKAAQHLASRVVEHVAGGEEP